MDVSGLTAFYTGSPWYVVLPVILTIALLFYVRQNSQLRKALDQRADEVNKEREQLLNLLLTKKEDGTHENTPHV
ncbi:hypothetical protein [Paenibacillus sp. FSL M7-0896]|uniref:hypothetical protein n=1 Tax=Paenibacillus sp. FSL M7-0896 TaxID=2921610 RepID=UPI0030DBC9B1